jgi:hypothetical protein
VVSVSKVFPTVINVFFIAARRSVTGISALWSVSEGAAVSGGDMGLDWFGVMFVSSFWGAGAGIFLDDGI